jgi:hypothetical protein
MQRIKGTKALHILGPKERGNALHEKLASFILNPDGSALRALQEGHLIEVEKVIWYLLKDYKPCR